MKKFQFSLDHVRDYRDRLLDEETGKLQRLQAERDRLEQQINQLKPISAQVSEEMRKAQAEGSPPWNSGDSVCSWRASACRSGS